MYTMNVEGTWEFLNVNLFNVLECLLHGLIGKASLTIKQIKLHTQLRSFKCNDKS